MDTHFSADIFFFPLVIMGVHDRGFMGVHDRYVEVVNVFVTVRDKKGNIVKDLVKEDFTLSEDGRMQTIRYFSRESDLLLTIGLLVDTTLSESNMLDVERKASLAFLNRMLRPEKDTAFLIQYYYEIELLQDLTSSREKLAAAMDLLESHGAGNPGGGRGPGQPGGRGPRQPGGPTGYETALFEINAQKDPSRLSPIQPDGDCKPGTESANSRPCVHIELEIRRPKSCGGSQQPMIPEAIRR